MSKQITRFWAIVPAAGVGKRLGGDTPKQYLPIHGRTVIAHTLTKLLAHPGLRQLVVVVAKNDTHWLQIENDLATDKLMTVIGGEERHHSVYEGLLALQSQAALDDWVLVHDAVRPCVSHQDIDHLIAQVKHHPVGGLLGVRVRDTLKRTDQHGLTIGTVDRDSVWQAYTPQLFRYGLLMRGLQLAIARNQPVLDESSAIELMGQQPKMVEGAASNIKITYPEDVALAEQLLVSPFGKGG
jgi:2-C-methyl-D-erythritol 4-phosphate cytidylyltransferase